MKSALTLMFNSSPVISIIIFLFVMLILFSLIFKLFPFLIFKLLVWSSVVVSLVVVILARLLVITLVVLLGWVSLRVIAIHVEVIIMVESSLRRTKIIFLVGVLLMKWVRILIIIHSLIFPLKEITVIKRIIELVVIFTLFWFITFVGCVLLMRHMIIVLLIFILIMV